MSHSPNHVPIPMFGTLSEMTKTEAEAMFIWEPLISPPAFRALQSTDLRHPPHEFGRTLFSKPFSLTSNQSAQYIYHALGTNGFVITHLSFSVKNNTTNSSDIWFLRGTNPEAGDTVLHLQHYNAQQWQNVNITYSVPWLCPPATNEGSVAADGLHFYANMDSTVVGVVHGYLVPIGVYGEVYSF